MIGGLWRSSSPALSTRESQRGDSSGEGEAILASQLWSTTGMFKHVLPERFGILAN
jgi:hypothetical protein